MKNLKRVLLSWVGVYVLAALPLAYAQNAAGADNSIPKMHPGQRVQEIYNRLNLTDDQKKELESNKQQHRAKMEKARQGLNRDKEALKAELMKPRLDMPKINEIHDQIKALQNQMEDNKLSSILAVRSILTPDQFTAFINLMHKHKQEHE